MGIPKLLELMDSIADISDGYNISEVFMNPQKMHVDEFTEYLKYGVRVKVDVNEIENIYYSVNRSGITFFLPK